SGLLDVGVGGRRALRVADLGRPGETDGVGDPPAAGGVRRVDVEVARAAVVAEELGDERRRRAAVPAAVQDGVGVGGAEHDRAALVADPVQAEDGREPEAAAGRRGRWPDRKSTRLNSSHQIISYAVFCLKKKKKTQRG